MDGLGWKIFSVLTFFFPSPMLFFVCFKQKWKNENGSNRMETEPRRWRRRRWRDDVSLPASLFCYAINKLIKLWSLLYVFWSILNIILLFFVNRNGLFRLILFKTVPRESVFEPVCLIISDGRICVCVGLHIEDWKTLPCCALVSFSKYLNDFLRH